MQDCEKVRMTWSVKQLFLLLIVADVGKSSLLLRFADNSFSGEFHCHVTLLEVQKEMAFVIFNNE